MIHIDMYTNDYTFYPKRQSVKNFLASTSFTHSGFTFVVCILLLVGVGLNRYLKYLLGLDCI